MSSFNPGGTERQMIELVRRLDRGRWQVEVACIHAEGAWLPRVVESAPLTRFAVTSFRRPAIVGQMRSFARWCTAKRIAVVHTTDLPTNIFGLPASALAGVPVRIANRREVNANRTAIEISLQRVAYTFAHRVVANCRAAADRLRREQVAASKIAIVPNGLDAGTFHDRAARPRLRTITVVANLRPEKGHDVVIDAAVDVLRRFPDARFEFVGGGPERARLMARAEARQVAHALTFVGHCDDVAARLAATDIFVLPSRSEAFPNALLEAMAAGLPVVASAVGGVLEVVDAGRSGVLVRPGDVPALADALCTLMSDPARAAAFGRAARDDVRSRYGFDRMIASFEDIYRHELTRRGLAPAAAAPELAAS